MISQNQKNLNIKKNKKRSFHSSGIISAKIIIFGVIAIFIVLIGSIIFSNYYLSKKIAEIESKLPSSQKVETRPEAPKVTLPKIIYNLTGTIQELSANSLILKATIPTVDETGQPSSRTEIKKVTVGPVTKFSRLAFVTQEGTNRQVPKETSIAFRDFKMGDYVEVISNRDVSRPEEIEATQVRILPKSF